MSNLVSDAKACFSSKVEYRAVIRYLYLKGETGKEIHGELADVYESSASSYAQVKFWLGEFKRGRTSLEDEARSGRPLDTTDEEMCKKVRDLVYSDRRIQVEEIAQALGISHGSVSTILLVYYANLLDQLRTAIREKRRGKLSKGVLLPQDNARVHTCQVAMDAVERNGYELIPYPAFSPDLAPSDFFLFPNLKKDIRGLHFRSDEEVVTAVEEWVNGKDPDFFSSGLMALEHRWSKCITLEGNNIEKEEVDLNRK